MINVTVNDKPAHTSMLKRSWGGLVFLVFVILGILHLLLQVISWMSDEQQLPFSKIMTQGKLLYMTAEEVRESLDKIAPLQSFMLQDVDVIHNVILKLPWVENASVRKQWPDMLKVHITEYQPEAIWNEVKLLDPKATIFDGSPEQVKDLNLVSLYGPEGREKEVLEAWREMRELLAVKGLDIAVLSLNDRRSWRILTRNGIRIELGREFRFERLKRLINLSDDINRQGKEVQYVDLRYDIGAAVGWKGSDAPIEE